VARQLLAYILAAIAAVAEMAVTATRLVWKAGRWVVESITPAPRRAAPAGGGSADMAAALAEAATAPVGSPAALTAAPAPKKAITPDEAAREWGSLAQRFALSQGTLTDEEPDLRALDEAAQAWLRGLPWMDLMNVANGDALMIGRHMLGMKPLASLPPCPTLEEWEQGKREMAQMTAEKRERMAEGRKAISDAIQDLIDSPSYVPCQGV
jgi:hypothetical protein